MAVEVVGYAYDFCNEKLEETQNVIPVFAYNLFSFDFVVFVVVVVVVKGIRLFVWLTKQLNIGAANLTNVQYANIGLQVTFIDTMKYYQQSLSCLAKSADENEIANIISFCQKFIEGNTTYSTAFNSLFDQDKTWVLDYLLGRKEVIPYKLIKSHDN